MFLLVILVPALYYLNIGHLTMGRDLASIVIVAVAAILRCCGRLAILRCCAHLAATNKNHNNFLKSKSSKTYFSSP